MPIPNVAQRSMVRSADGTYVLRAVAATAPPTVWISNETVSITVLADTLLLGDRGQGLRITVQRYREASGPEPFVRREESGLTYVRNGDRIEISLACPDLALCVAPPHFVGRANADGLLFTAALSYVTPLQYERVRR